MKVEAREEALRLRVEQQLSLKQISALTGLSKSTLSVLLRDYPLTTERINELGYSGRVAGAAANRKAGIERQVVAEAKGKELIQVDDRFKSLCLLYWGEGRKTGGRFSIANSDPSMVSYICKTLHYLGYADSISMTVQCYDSYTDDEIVQYWKGVTGFECKVYRVKKSVASLNKRGNTIPFGTMEIAIHKKELLDMVLGGIKFLGR